MNLIATGKIADYINKHPEARVPLLSWLKEWPYEPQHEPLDAEGKTYHGNGKGEAAPGTGDYRIRFLINYAVQTECITWVGSRQEHEQEIARELAELRLKHPNLITETIYIEELELEDEPPEPPDFDQWPEDEQAGADASETNYLATSPQQMLNPYRGNEVRYEQRFKTESEYTDGLNRATAIFDANPGTPEFDELLALIKPIQYYEAHLLKFPSLHFFEVIENRRQLFGLTPDDLASMINSQDNINLYLSGELQLPTKVLQRLHKALFIQFPLNDKRFS